jgi:hypothetical protein
MIQLTILPDFLRVSIPKEMKSQAPILLKDIWCTEFDHRLDFILELTRSVQEFAEKAKFSPQILVYL